MGSALSERRVSIIDRNRDLYLTPVVPQPGIFRGTHKLTTQAETMAWSDTADMLCAVADGRFATWYYPNAVFVDRDLLPSTTETKDASDLGKTPYITNLTGSRATVRKVRSAPRRPPPWIFKMIIFISAWFVFLQTRALSLEQADGALLTVSLSAYAPMLHSLVRERRWDEATRLCRFVKVQGIHAL